MPAIRYTQHAETVMMEREIRKSWVEQTVLDPEWRQPDPSGADVQRCFRMIPERGGRVLRGNR